MKGLAFFVVGFALSNYGTLIFGDHISIILFTIKFVLETLINIMYDYIPVIIIDVIIQNFMEEYQTKSSFSIDSCLNCIETYQKIEKALEKYLLVHYGGQQILIIVTLFTSISSLLDNDYLASPAINNNLIGFMLYIIGCINLR